MHMSSLVFIELKICMNRKNISAIERKKKKRSIDVIHSWQVQYVRNKSDSSISSIVHMKKKKCTRVERMIMMWVQSMNNVFICISVICMLDCPRHLFSSPLSHRTKLKRSISTHNYIYSSTLTEKEAFYSYILSIDYIREKKPWTTPILR